MKKIAKILLASGASLILAAGSVMTYLQTQRALEPVSDLTLANIEALGIRTDEIQEGTSVPCTYTGHEDDYCVYTAVMTDGSTAVKMIQYCVNYWC